MKKILLLWFLVLFISFNCSCIKTSNSNYSIAKMSNIEITKIFKLEMKQKIIFAGLANFGVHKNERIPFVIFDKIQWEPAILKIKYKSKIFELEVEKLSSADFKINRIYLQKTTNLPYPQLIIDYCAGSAGTGEWSKESYLYVISWLDSEFKVIFDHLLLEENHYSNKKSITRYNYQFKIENGLSKVILTDQDQHKTNFVWKNKGFVEE